MPRVTEVVPFEVTSTRVEQGQVICDMPHANEAVPMEVTATTVEPDAEQGITIVDVVVGQELQWIFHPAWWFL